MRRKGRVEPFIKESKLNLKLTMVEKVDDKCSEEEVQSLRQMVLEKCEINLEANAGNIEHRLFSGIFLSSVV